MIKSNCFFWRGFFEKVIKIMSLKGSILKKILGTLLKSLKIIFYYKYVFLNIFYCSFLSFLCLSFSFSPICLYSFILKQTLEMMKRNIKNFKLSSAHNHNFVYKCGRHESENSHFKLFIFYFTLYTSRWWGFQWIFLHFSLMKH